MKIGEIIEATKTLSNGERITFSGVIHGRLRDRGGWKWLIKEVAMHPDEIIGVRKVNKKEFTVL